MTSHQPIFRATAAVVLVVLAPIAAAQEPQGKGIAVVFDGRTAQSAVRAYEFSDIKFANGGFTLIPLPGQVGPRPDRAELLHYVDYRKEHNQQLLNKMLALAKQFPKAAAPLAPYIAGVQRSMAQAKAETQNAIAKQQIPAAQADVLAPSLLMGEVTYFNVRASSFQEGRLGFLHRDGTFSIPAELLTESFLRKVEKTAPAIAKKDSFVGLMKTFSGKVVVGPKEYTGIRLIKQEGTTLSLATDQGRVAVDAAKLDKEFVSRLQTGSSSFRVVLESFHLAREKQAAAQAEHDARAEADRLRRNREMAAIDATAMKRIMEEATRKLEIENSRKMDEGIKWAIGLGALLWAFNEFDGIPAYTPPVQQDNGLSEVIRRNREEDERRQAEDKKKEDQQLLDQRRRAADDW